MRCSWHVDGRTWRLSLQLHPEDPVTGRGQGSMQVSLLAREARVRLPFAIDEPHPDLAALAALVIVTPWVARRLVMDRGVSRAFADKVERILGIEMSPIDDSLESREPGNTLVLSYSAGFDSAASSLLLPDGIPHIHHLRSPHPRIPDRSSWRVDAIRHLVDKAGERGRQTQIVVADFEHLCHPYPTLPSWFAVAVGCLLLADHNDAGAIALGGTFETFYMDMARSWTGGPPVGSGIDPLPEAVGLPIQRPVMGVTEVGTMRLVLESDLADISRSCVLGTFDNACGVCSKCIRKDLLGAAIRGHLPDHLKNLSADAPGWVAIRDAKEPIYMQAQLEYSLARLDVSGLPFEELRTRLSPVAAETEWMERAYRPALARGMSQRFADGVEDRIQAGLGWMSRADIAVAESWVRPRPSSARTQSPASTP